MWAQLTCEEKNRSSLFEMLLWRCLFDVQKGNVKKRAGDGVVRSLGEQSELEMYISSNGNIEGI